MKTFTARVVAAELMDDLNSFSLVLIENLDGSGERLEIHRAIQFDDVDKQMGMDTYCLCTESGATCYGGVVDWKLGQGTLEIRLNDDASHVLCVDNGYLISLNFSDTAYMNLHDSLVRLFGFMPGYDH